MSYSTFVLPDCSIGTPFCCRRATPGLRRLDPGDLDVVESTTSRPSCRALGVGVVAHFFPLWEKVTRNNPLKYPPKNQENGKARNPENIF